MMYLVAVFRLVLTDVLRVNQTIVRKWSEGFSNDKGTMGMDTPHEVLR